MNVAASSGKQKLMIPILRGVPNVVDVVATSVAAAAGFFDVDR